MVTPTSPHGAFFAVNKEGSFRPGLQRAPHPQPSPRRAPRHAGVAGTPLRGEGGGVGMTFSILITGFGPFPGARSIRPRSWPKSWRNGDILHSSMCVARFTFSRSVTTPVNREMPALLESHRPDALIMFGLALRTKRVRIETRARNVLARGVPDVAGQLPPVPAQFLPEGRTPSRCARRRSACSWPRDRRDCRLRSRAMPATTSATICAGAPPRRPAAARRG